MTETAIHSVVSEGQHFVAKNAGMVVSKGSLTALNAGVPITHGLEGAFANMTATANSAGLGGVTAAVGGLGGLIAMGAVGAISAAMAQMDYRHEISKMKEIYRNELAAQLGKPAKSISDDDLYKLAQGDPERGIEGNKIIADEISKKKKERALGVGLSAAATVTSFMVVQSFFASVASETLAASIGLPGMGAAVMFVAETLVGVAMYNLVKQPMHWLGHKLFGLDKETTHDRIANIQADIQKGKGVGQEQVLEVFVSANKQLETFVDKQYGKPFENMTHEERQRVVEDINQVVPLAQLTQDIQSGKYDVGELAFAVEGKTSGHKHEEQSKPHGWMDHVATNMKAMFDFKSKAKKAEPKKATYTHDENAWHPAHDQKDKASFQERYAPNRRPSLGSVERLEQARAEDALNPQQAAV